MMGTRTNFADKDEITREDLLRAMEKLSHIIEADKYTDDQDTNNHYYESPDKFNSGFKQNRDGSQNVRGDYLREPALIENVKAAAKHLSDMVEKNERIGGMHGKSSTYIQGSTFDENRALKPSSTINRLYELDGKKKERIAALQFQKYKEELSSLKAKPDISLNSKILAETKHKEPIYQRSQAILKQKEENLTRLRRQIEDDKMEKDPIPTFQPNLISKKGSTDEKVRSAKEFTNQVYAWQVKKQETLQKEQYENITKELEELTFKPKINQKSVELAYKKGDRNAPVEQRLAKLKEEHDAKLKDKLEKERPEFKPVLNEKSVILSKNRKSQIENIWRQRRYDQSSTNMNAITEESHRNSFEGSRSVTPGRSRISAKSPLKGNTNTSKTPRVHEVEYTPAMDFLLRKLI